MEKHEAMAREVKKLQADFAGMCTLFRVQQEALETLGEAVTKHQRLLEAMAGYTPPTPGASLNN